MTNMELNSTQSYPVLRKRTDNNGVSVIIPFLNEEDGLKAFCEGIDDYAGTVDFPIEAVFVDDGSTDNSVDILSSFKFDNIYKCKLISFSRNFGSHAGIRAGLQNASYDICTWLAADLQDPFELIKEAYNRIVVGNIDAVYVGRSSVNIPATTKFFSHMYSALMRKYAVKNYEMGGIQTVVFGKKIKDYLNLNIESNSSIILQILNAGFKTETVYYGFNERVAGKSKWTFSKKIKLAIDSFVSFSFMPIRLVSIVGIMVFIAAIILALQIAVNKCVNPSAPVGYSTIACIMLGGVGITNISLGVIAEYLWRTYDAARNRPLFIVSDIRVLKENDL